MKKESRVGLKLNRETVRLLADRETRTAAGGSLETVCSFCETCGRATCKC